MTKHSKTASESRIVPAGGGPLLDDMRKQVMVDQQEAVDAFRAVVRAYFRGELVETPNAARPPKKPPSAMQGSFFE